MQISETFTLAERWLATPYKALRHGASLTTPLYNIMRSGTREERQEASRLYQRVQTVMSQIRTACPYVPKDCYRVAFLPVATYNDDTCETITPTDYLQYPEDCTLAQRLQMMYTEAERLMQTSEDSIATESHTSDIVEIEDVNPAPLVASEQPTAKPTNRRRKE